MIETYILSFLEHLVHVSKGCFSWADELKELKTSTLDACGKKIWPSSVERGNVFESLENEIGGLFARAESIGVMVFGDTEDTIEDTIEDIFCGCH
ncbi:hypothetical protein NPIL_223641 [Nephila pilipes]|uniref:Uncharacterized protein n=1 Tax=Nephila pilipes TaxID=299642 RepID=A0A8X6R8V4_NEPPI|nr:hypothetical protein NPIL_223641 [Nephila pilipes]